MEWNVREMEGERQRERRRKKTNCVIERIYNREARVSLFAHRSTTYIEMSTNKKMLKYFFLLFVWNFTVSHSYVVRVSRNCSTLWLVAAEPSSWSISIPLPDGTRRVIHIPSSSVDSQAETVCRSIIIDFQLT